MVLGSVCAMISGMSYPSIVLIFGEMMDLFVRAVILGHFLPKIKDFLDHVGLTEDDIFKDAEILNP